MRVEHLNSQCRAQPPTHDSTPSKVKETPNPHRNNSDASSGPGKGFSLLMYMVLLTSLTPVVTGMASPVAQHPLGDTFRPSKPDPTCVCDPLCDIIPPTRMETCTKVSRKDCSCCVTCASEEGESCHSETKPCDVTKRLQCDEEDQTCKVADLVVCNFEGKVFQVGQKYPSADCQLKCQCQRNGNTVCEPMKCRRGLHKKGSFADDPYCVEREADTHDQCCVLVICSDAFEEEDDDEEEEQEEHDQEAEKRTPISTGKIVFPEKNKLSKQESTSSKENIEFLQITPTSIQIQFPGITGGNLMYVEESKKQLPAGKEIPWQNAIILEGNKIFTLTGLKAGVKYRLRWQAPDRQYPDIMVSTKEFDEKPPKIILTKITFDSATVSFDHFAPNGYRYNYVAMYKPVREDASWKSQEDELDHESSAHHEDLPSITIRNLLPDTKYVVRVAIYEDYSTRTLGKSTEVIEIKTNVGCRHLEKSYPVGVFNLGCESSCQCDSNGQVTCGQRCKKPFHRSGSFSNDPLCVEQFVDGDECCVLITCAGNAEIDEEGPCTSIECGPNAECRHEVFRGEDAGTICVCKDGYNGDPDSRAGCQAVVTSLGSEEGQGQSKAQPEGCQVKNETYPVGDTWYEGCDYQCSCSEKFEILCQPRCKTSPPEENVDEQCEFRPDPDDSCCKVMYCPDPHGGEDDLKPVGLPFDGCVFKNQSYDQGQRFYDGCESQCQCMGYGDMVCLARCPPTAPPPGQNCYTLPDASDPCCNITVCDNPVLDPDQNVPKEEVMKKEFLSNQELKESRIVNNPVFNQLIPDNGCVYNNFFLQIGESFYKACQQKCKCIKPNTVRCIERCSEVPLEPHCHRVPDPKDECCVMMRCPPLEARFMSRMIDLSEENHSKLVVLNVLGTEKYGLEIGEIASFQHEVQGTIYALNESTLFIQDFHFDGLEEQVFFYAGLAGASPTPTNGIILPYPFKGQFYQYDDQSAPPLFLMIGQDVILTLPDGLSVEDVKWLSVWDRKSSTELGHVNWPTSNDEKEKEETFMEGHCEHNGVFHPPNSDFYDECDQFCHCSEVGELECHPIQCPSSFGLDVINPFCLQWDEHESFVPKAPMCCPPVPICISDGTCHYQSHKFNNYETIPANLTGCEQRCYCENGEVLCQDACYELSEEAPGYLPCSKDAAIKVPQEERPCCLTWGCPELPELPKKLEILKSEPLNSTAVKFDMRIPRELNGFLGFFEVFYTSGIQGHPDPNQWPKRVITPENGKLEVNNDDISHLVLDKLLPNQQYFLKINFHVKMGDEEVAVKGDIMSARTLPVEETTVPPTELMRIDLDLSVSKINVSSAFLSWRFFSSAEKKYVDGVQLRFIDISNGVSNAGVPGTSPFIHRDTNFFLLHNLKPDTEYMVDLYIIPVPRANVEMISEKNIKFRTLPPLQDPYDVVLKLMSTDVTGNSVELSWDGLPSPTQKFASLLKFIYSEDHVNAVAESNVIYREVKINDSNFMRIRKLTSDMRYQIWMEAFMRNGKVIKSNVVDVVTKNWDDESRSAIAQPTSQGNSEAEAENESAANDSYPYFNGMVAAAIIAAFAILALVIVLALYLKRTTTYKAIISGHGGNKSRGRSNVPMKTSASNHFGSPSASLENGNNDMEMNKMNGRK